MGLNPGPGYRFEPHLRPWHHQCVWICLTATSTLGPAYNEEKDAKETARYKWMLVVTKLFNMAVNDFDAKESARYSRVLTVTELILSGTQCMWVKVALLPCHMHAYIVNTSNGGKGRCHTRGDLWDHYTQARESAGERFTLNLKPMRKDTPSPKQEQSVAPQNGLGPTKI